MHQPFMPSFFKCFRNITEYKTANFLFFLENLECSCTFLIVRVLLNIFEENQIDIQQRECKLLNKYFSFISSLEDANVPLPDIELKTDNFLRDIVITTEEIIDIIKIINPNKASGPDIISQKM
jgi:hypothetical protein